MHNGTMVIISLASCNKHCPISLHPLTVQSAVVGGRRAMLQLSPRSPVIIVRSAPASCSVSHADSAPGVTSPHLPVQLGGLGRIQAQRLHP